MSGDAQRCPACEGEDTARQLPLDEEVAVVLCGSCGHQFVEPPLPPEDYWRAENLAAYSRGFPATEARRDVLLEEVQCRLGGRGPLLDVGCGVGRHVRFARERGWEAYGFDISRRAVENVPASLGRFCRSGRSVSECFGGQAFSVVTVWDVIEHAVDVGAFVGDIARCLRPSGVMVLETPAGEFVGRRVALWLDRVTAAARPRFSRRFYYRQHLHYFSERSLGHLLGHHGFSILRHERIPTDISKSRAKLQDCPAARGAARAMWSLQRLGLLRGNKHLVICRFSGAEGAAP